MKDMIKNLANSKKKMKQKFMKLSLKMTDTSMNEQT